MKNERIDETIDRVAAELTAVAADPGFTVRLRDRLQQPQRRTATSLLLLASATAAVFITAVVVLNQRPITSPDAVLSITFTFVPTELPRGGFAGSVSADGVFGSNDADAMPTLPLGDEDGAVAGGPDALTVAALIVEPMQLPAAVDIAPLDVPQLEIVDIAAGDEAKEPK